MTERYLMKWYKEMLFPHVEKAIDEKKIRNDKLIYGADLLIAISYRETWTKVAKYVDKKMNFESICEIVKGDYSKREGETESKYHGFGFWQIDIKSYPDFVKSGDWKNPFKCCCKAIEVLEEKRQSLVKNWVFNGDQEIFLRSIIAAYNCGQGNVLRSLKEGKDVDERTHEHNYSKMVLQYRKLYNELV
jgi:hypothetical protein